MNLSLEDGNFFNQPPDKRLVIIGEWWRSAPEGICISAIRFSDSSQPAFSTYIFCFSHAGGKEARGQFYLVSATSHYPYLMNSE